MPIFLNKKRGETPLACLERYRSEHPELSGIPLTYAGRLDPMATGLLLVLSGEECKEKDAYSGLDKTYEFEVLLGFETDSHDVLGLVSGARDAAMPKEADIAGILPALVGSYEEPYPPFSSKPVEGKPLFAWAREGALGKIAIPTHAVHIKQLSFVSACALSGDVLQKEIKARVAEVVGDFRQEEILAGWQHMLEDRLKVKFPILRFSADVSSGTYIRMLAVRIGKALGVPATICSIKRTRIGEFVLE